MKVFYWFVHCRACDLANRRGQAIFALMVHLGWTPEEQERLRQEAKYMEDYD